MGPLYLTVVFRRGHWDELVMYPVLTQGLLKGVELDSERRRRGFLVGRGGHSG